MEFKLKQKEKHITVVVLEDEHLWVSEKTSFYIFFAPSGFVTESLHPTSPPQLCFSLSYLWFPPFYSVPRFSPHPCSFFLLYVYLQLPATSVLSCFPVSPGRMQHAILPASRPNSTDPYLSWAHQSRSPPTAEVPFFHEHAGTETSLASSNS